MLCGLFYTRIDLACALGFRRRQSRTTSKSTSKNMKSLKGLIGSPKNFLHTVHFGQDDVRNLIVRAQSPVDQDPAFKSCSPPPSVIYAWTPPVSSSSCEKTPTSPTLNAASVLEITVQDPSIQKIKRKSVPVYLPSEPEQPPVPKLEMEVALSAIVESEEDPQRPVDQKGRPLHLIGGEYMTQTIKTNWDKQMAAIASALKAGEDEPESIKQL